MSSPRTPAEATPAGLEPLAVLPVFVRLQGRRAVVAGGGAGAAWKARLLAAAGAAVDVFAPEPSEEMRRAPAESVAGSILLHARTSTAADLAGAAFAVAALEDDDECAAFVTAARAAGVIVNAVDRPHLCDIQFGAIVNRSPLVVGISTDGAAPVFGQAIRSRIETLLPRGFARWAAAAKGWRELVLARLPKPRQRRAFWERFAERALTSPHRAPAAADFEDLAAAGARGGSGSVVLIDAGSGDPELLTLRAVRALRTADVVLCDELVAPAVLDYARREVHTMSIGGGFDRRDESDALMVRLAHQGKRVVRLEGGDPLLFGSSGEEACARAGIPVEAVPAARPIQGATPSTATPRKDPARRVQA